MNNLGLFFQFGIRMQGGPAFVKRIRETVSQLQTRTRSSFACNCRYKTQNYYCSSSNQTNFGPTNPCSPGSGGTFCAFDAWYQSTFGCSSWFCENTLCICYSTCFTAYGAWSNTTSCTPGTLRECQTIYFFREEDWSEYEEVDVCTPQSPTPALGAVEIECIPQ